MTIATLAQDYAFGRDGVAAFKEALAKTGATLAAEEYAPPNTTDFTAPAQRLFDALKDKPGTQDHLGDLGRRRHPLTKLLDMNPERYGIEIVDRRQHPAGDGGLQDASPAWRARPTTITTSRRTR